MKSPLFYCLQVWLTSAGTGSAFWIFSPGLHHVDHTIRSYAEYYSLILTGVVIFSIPSFILFLAGVIYFNRQPWRLSTKKLVTAGWGLLLAVVPVWILFGRIPSAHRLMLFGMLGIFAAPLEIAIFFFGWPRRIDVK